MIQFLSEQTERVLDIHALVVKHPSATFFLRIEGDAMKHEHICSGDILVVDRSLSPLLGKMVVAVIDGEFVVKKIDTASDFYIWGVVSYVISAR